MSYKNLPFMWYVLYSFLDQLVFLKSWTILNSCKGLTLSRSKYANDDMASHVIIIREI